MASAGFDPKQYTDNARQQWDGVADSWHKWMLEFAGWVAPITDAAFEMAQLRAGQRVLEVAAGDGNQSLQAAQRVGAEGYVLATDLSASLIAHAEQAAQDAGLTNMATRVMDGQTLDGLDDDSFDVVLSRFGLMLFPEPGKGLQAMRRVLKPDGRKVAVVFSTPDKNPWLSAPAMIAFRHAGMPPPQPGQPGLFSLGAPGVLANAFEVAGFRDIETQTIDASITLDSAAACRQFLEEAGGIYKLILSRLDAAGQQAAWDEIEQILAQFEGDNGFQAPGEAVIAVGVK